jgi:hypothetical protein
MNDQPRHHGLVLLLTLVLLALGAVVVGGLVRTSLGRAILACDAQETLQRRWGMMSIQAVVLPMGPLLLGAANKDAATPVVFVDGTITLGGQGFHLRLSDEQAKANLNLLHQTLGREGAVRKLERWLALSPDGDALTLDLRPQAAAGATPQATPQAADSAKDHATDSDGPNAPAFSTWAQVFADPQPARLFTFLPAATPAVTDQLTCWSDGRLNLNLASDEVLELVVGDLLSSSQRADLLAARSTQPEEAPTPPATTSTAPDKPSRPEARAAIKAAADAKRAAQAQIAAKTKQPAATSKPTDRPARGIAAVLTKLSLTAETREALQARLCLQSGYFGLLIRSDDDWRSHYSWTVAQVQASAQPKTKTPNQTPVDQARATPATSPPTAPITPVIHLDW